MSHPMTDKLTPERIDVAKTWLRTEPNAPKHFTKHGNEKARETILAALELAREHVTTESETK